MRRGSGKGGVLLDTEQVGGRSGSPSSVSSTVRMQARTPRTLREPQEEETEPRPRLPVEAAGFLAQVPAGPGAQVTGQTTGRRQLTSVAPPGSECRAQPSSPAMVARLRGERAVRTAPTPRPPRSRQERGAGEGGVHPSCPACGLGLSPDHPMSPDRPDKAFLQPRLKHKPWGGVGWGSGREAWASEGRPAHSPGASTLPSSRTVTPAPHTCHQSQPWCPTQCGIGWHQGPGHGAHTCHSPPAPRTPP